MKDLLTVTDVVENAFCSKFTYYSLVLGLRQYEEKRGTVKTGRALHKRYEKSNRSYIAPRINGRKLIALRLYSENLGLSGMVDEAIDTPEGIILVERKYSDFTEISDSIKTQLGLLSILLEENLHKPVKRAIVIFVKSKRVEREVPITEELKKFALQMLQETKETVRTGNSPPTVYGNKCLNCCFRKICPTGSLNTK